MYQINFTNNLREELQGLQKQTEAMRFKTKEEAMEYIDLNPIIAFATEVTMDKEIYEGYTSGKKYLLGEDKDGTKYWLKEPSWDCGWYWGFGYIETKYSHQHATNFYQEFFNPHEDNNPILETRTFTEDEGYKLSELFEEFYTLKKAAEMWGRGGCHITKGFIPKKAGLVQEINETLIPMVTEKIIEILTPQKRYCPCCGQRVGDEFTTDCCK